LISQNYINALTKMTYHSQIKTATVRDLPKGCGLEADLLAWQSLSVAYDQSLELIP
jgi:hypothetical protein